MNDNDAFLRVDDAWDGSPAGGLTDLAIAVAACELAMLAGSGGGRTMHVEPLPAGLADAIGRAAAGHVSRTTASSVGSLARRSRDGLLQATGSDAESRGGLRARLMSLAGWCVAAGLGLALLYRQAPGPRDSIPRGSDTAVVQSVAPLAADKLRERLLAEDPDAIAVAWTPGKDPAVAGVPAGASLGDVVWSQSRQQGYMRFRGLAANDPDIEQYQLWIFDAERDAAHPVDGGVFDVAITDATGEVCVPIDARLPIGKPTLFAITVEKPGGVVVSTRERLPLLAQVP